MVSVADLMKVASRAQITAEAVLASAAIPNLFRSVHVGDGVFWDGLFSQNPPVRDLLEDGGDQSGVTLLDDLLITRLLDDDAQRLRARVVSIAGAIRHLAAGLSRTLPSVWHC